MRKSRILLLMIAPIIASMAVAACAAEEAAEPVAPQAAAAPADPAQPQAADGAPSAPRAAMAADTPLPAQAAADPQAPQAADSGPAAPRAKVETRTGPEGGGANLHDSQVAKSVGRFRSTMAPWRDGGGNRIFSTPGLRSAVHNQPEGRRAAVDRDWNHFERGAERLDAETARGRCVPGRTPITAADFKAYWEHGAKPENIVAWAARA